MRMRKNRVSYVLDQNGVMNNALTRTAYRVTYMVLFPVFYVQYLTKLIALNLRSK